MISEEMQAAIEALELALDETEHGNIEAQDESFVAAYAGDGGYLVQMHADGTFDLDGEPTGAIPAELMDRVRAVLVEVDK